MNRQLFDKWVKRASAGPCKIAFPEAAEEKILLAAKRAMDTGAVIPVLVGNPREIRAAAERYGVDIEAMRIVSNEAPEEAVERYFSRKQALSLKALIRKSRDPMNYAFILQELGEVDAVFAGLSHTTGEVIMAAQTFVGLAEDISTVSSIGIMDIPGYEGPEGTLLAFSDSAVCVAPDSERLADIAISACETVRDLLEWTPRCAMLSYSTVGSSQFESAIKVAEAVRIANEKRPELFIDGEFQLDSALEPEAAGKKVKRESEVAGRANIIIYPDIGAGNIGVKLMQKFAKCDAYGPMLQGLAKPVSDCSRSAPVTELVGNIIMLAVRAQAAKKR